VKRGITERRYTRKMRRVAWDTGIRQTQNGATKKYVKSVLPSQKSDRFVVSGSRVSGCRLETCLATLSTDSLSESHFLLFRISSSLRRTEHLRIENNRYRDYTREAAIRPNKHHRTGNDRIACRPRSSFHVSGDPQCRTPQSSSWIRSRIAKHPLGE
jgi:hypothetical protein